MLKVKEVIVVEGRYDKNTLSQVVDAAIIETAGFGIFSDREKIELLRRLADKRGIIIMTDSDGAGFLIRNYLKGAISGNGVKHAYIPDIEGRERRKRTAAKEGKLGVEGMEPDVLIDALRRAGATIDDAEPAKESDRITKADMFALGLSGKTGAAELRKALKARLGLPDKLSADALLDVLNALYSPEELSALLRTCPPK